MKVWRTLPSSAGLLCLLCAVVLALAAAPAGAQSNLAESFKAVPRDAKIVLMPIDLELFSVSGGGIFEPRADWTDAANRFVRAALLERKKSLGAVSVELNEQDADDFAEVNALHAAIAQAIAFHHFGPSNLRLPTKDGKLDWSMGDAVAPIKKKTGGNYALFTWMRDSYASGERIAAVIVMAIFGIGVHPGGMQIGYASLVDLDTGQIVWFNRLIRGTGDLREAEKAAETLNALLADFPPVQKE